MWKRSGSTKLFKIWMRRSPNASLRRSPKLLRIKNWRRLSLSWLSAIRPKGVLSLPLKAQKGKLGSNSRSWRRQRANFPLPGQPLLSWRRNSAKRPKTWTRSSRLHMTNGKRRLSRTSNLSSQLYVAASTSRHGLRPWMLLEWTPTLSWGIWRRPWILLYMYFLKFSLMDNFC